MAAHRSGAIGRGRWFEPTAGYDETHRTVLPFARYAGIAFDDAPTRSGDRSGCDRLYSERLQHGRKFGDCVIVNPFSKRLANECGGRTVAAITRNQ